MAKYVPVDVVYYAMLEALSDGDEPHEATATLNNGRRVPVQKLKVHGETIRGIEREARMNYAESTQYAGELSRLDVAFSNVNPS